MVLVLAGYAKYRVALFPADSEARLISAGHALAIRHLLGGRNNSYQDSKNDGSWQLIQLGGGLGTGSFFFSLEKCVVAPD